jgi:hypothetical protein
MQGIYKGGREMDKRERDSVTTAGSTMALGENFFKK